MKILWLCGWYPHSENPLAGNFIVRHAASVAKVGGHTIELLHFAPFQVSVSQLIMRFLGRRFSGQPKTINHGISGVNEEVVAVPQLAGGIFKLMNVLIYYRVAYQKVKAKMHLMGMPTNSQTSTHHEYGIVHVHAADKIGVVATWFQKAFRYKIVYTEHWAIFNKQVADRFSRRNPWFQFSFRVLWRHTDVVAAISKTMLAQMEEELGKCKASVLLPNVVDPALLEPESGDSNTKPSNTIQFLHISNLESRKNLIPLIQAFLELRESSNDEQHILKLQIVGSNLETFQSQWAQVFEAQNWNQFGISYFESRPVAELKQFYQSADVLILPSSAENSPCVIVEAQYFGLPVIATKIGGIPEMVDESKGILISAKPSPEKMKKEIFHAMKEFLHRKSEFDSTTIKDSAQLQFHPDNASLDLVKTYASLKFTDQP